MRKLDDNSAWGYTDYVPARHLERVEEDAQNLKDHLNDVAKEARNAFRMIDAKEKLINKAYNIFAEIIADGYGMPIGQLEKINELMSEIITDAIGKKS